MLPPTEEWVADDHCLVKKVMSSMGTQEADALSKMKTQHDWDLNKATICAQKRSQHVGVYAGDTESYDSLSRVLDDVISLYHGINRKENIAQEEQYGKQVLPKLPAGEAIQSTRIRTARNLTGYPFTCNMSKEQRLEIESIMKQVFNGFSNEYLKGTYHPLEGMSEKKRQELIDAHYLFINDDPTLELLGTYDDWPAGRGIFINDNREKGVFIVWVGEEDQLRIMAMNKGSDVQAVWDLFYGGLEAVHKGLKSQDQDFVFDENLGYLSACPTNVGTGMRASVHVNLPNFATKEAVKEKVKELNIPIDVRGTRGESIDTTGCTIYDISNKGRLGSTMPEQVQTMVGGVKALLNSKSSANTNGGISKLATIATVGLVAAFVWKGFKRTQRGN